ncbi:MAG: Snf7 family protein [Planctomycetes bacterium]|nr:Snf7 family protein [Planctomycetota bacterium]
MNLFSHLFKNRDAEDRELLRKARRRVRRSIQEVQDRIQEAEHASSDCRTRIKDALRTGQEAKARQHAKMASYKQGRLFRLGNMTLMLEVIADNLEDKSAFKDTLGLIQGTTNLAPLNLGNLEDAFDKFTLQLENDTDLHKAVSQSLGLSLKVDDKDADSADQILGEIQAELHGGEAPRRDRASDDGELSGRIAQGRAAVDRLKNALADKKRGE